MAEKEFNTRIVHKHDTQANWEKAVGFIPKQGELIVYDVDENYDYQRIKIGDGVKNVNTLPFYNDGFVTSVNGVTGDVTIETETVKYIEQTLTDEQKSQARENTSAFGYNWHEVYNGEYCANIPGYEAIADWDMALAQVNSNNVPYLSGLLTAVSHLLEGNDKYINKEAAFENFLSNIIPLLEANIFASSFRLAYKKINLGVDNPSSYLYFFINYNESNNRWIITNLVNSSSIIIIDGVITVDGTPIYPDETLSISNRTADAKATGDALATKVSFTEEQSLTDEQKQQAQDNIGFSENDAIELAAKTGLITPTAAEDGSIYTDENGVLYSL